MIFLGLLILLLPTNIIETSHKHHLQILTEEENCYKISNHIFCHETKLAQKKFFFVDLIDWNSKSDFNKEMFFDPFLKDHIQLNILNLVSTVSVRYLFPDTINTANLLHFKGDLCLNSQCSVITPVVATVINKNNEETALSYSSSTFEDMMMRPLKDLLNTEDMYAKITKLLINRSSFNVIREIKSILENAKQIVVEADVVDDKMNDIYRFVSDIQNKTERDSNDILIEHYRDSESGKGMFVISEMEILFRVSLFLLLFIIVLLFNIYYCSSIAYSIYKRDLTSLED